MSHYMATCVWQFLDGMAHVILSTLCEISLFQTLQNKGIRSNETQILNHCVLFGFFYLNITFFSCIVSLVEHMLKKKHISWVSTYRFYSFVLCTQHIFIFFLLLYWELSLSPHYFAIFSCMFLSGAVKIGFLASLLWFSPTNTGWQWSHCPVLQEGTDQN